MLAIVVALVAGMTTASAATFTYDVPNVERVGDPTIESTGARSTQLSDMEEQSVSQPVAGRNAATTPVRLVNATNTADDLVGAACRSNSFG